MTPSTTLRRASLCLVFLLAGCAGNLKPKAPVTEPASLAAATQSAFINVHALIIVRHADIDVASKKTMADEAPLIARGEARAKELAYALKDAGITRIITSVTLRTRETAALVAAERSITPEAPFTHGKSETKTPAVLNTKKKEAAAVFAYLVQTGRPGDIVLLVHHHSVIPGLLKLLGAKGEPAFDDATEFDRIYVILPDPATSTYRILRLRYGGNWGTNSP